MSRQSQAIFYREILGYQAEQAANPAADPDPKALRAAAVGHLGASRDLDELLEEYAAAMEDQENHTPEQAAAAQRIADEMVPVRAATRIIAGGLPGRGG